LALVALAFVLTTATSGTDATISALLHVVVAPELHRAARVKPYH